MSFAEAWADAQADLDAEFAESFELTGMLGVAAHRLSPIPDPARTPVTLVGSFSREAEAPGRSSRQGEESGERPGYSSSRPVASFPHGRLPWTPRAGDRLKRLLTGEVFDVARVAMEGDWGRDDLFLSRL